MIHTKSHTSPQESIQKFLGILEGNQTKQPSNDIQIYQLMAEEMQKQMLELVQKNSEATLSKMHEIAQASLNKKSSELESLNFPNNQKEDVVLKRIQRETEAINRQMDEKSAKTEHMFENFAENLRTLENEIRDMREANFMSLKEKAALENQLKIKQRQVGIEEIAPKNQDSKVTNQEINKKIFGPKNEDIFNEENPNLPKGDQSLPSHNMIPKNTSNSQKLINTIELKNTKIERIEAKYIGSIESDIDGSFIHEEISIEKLEDELKLIETQDLRTIEIQREPKFPEVGNNIDSGKLKGDNSIPIQNKSIGEIEVEDEKENSFELDNQSVYLSDSINSDKIREAEERFQNLISGKNKNRVEEKDNWTHLAEERFKKNFTKPNLSNSNEDLESQINKLQENLSLINKSMLENINDQNLKEKFKKKDEEFKKELKIKMVDFKKGQLQIKEEYRREINLD